MQTAAKVHRLVAEYNWDDGLAPIWQIVDSVETEFATALMIYWRLDGPWLEEATATNVNAEAKRLAELVRSRLLAGRYPKRLLRYDPIADNRLSKVQVHQLRRAGLPTELIEPEYPNTT